MAHETLAWHFPEADPASGSFCMVRLGLIAHRLRVVPKLRKLSKAIDQAAAEAGRSGSGLLNSERIVLGWNHFGYLQYWRTVDTMLAWTRQSPHTEWWKWAVERQRTHGDVSIYHETYAARPSGFEAIYLNLGERRPAASAFGDLRPPKGAMATARGRLGNLHGVGVVGDAATIDPVSVRD
jgi:hypothetical protein